MRAVSLDHDTSRLMGIDVNRIITVVFLIGPALGAVAGMMVALYYGSFDFTLGMTFGLKAFIAAILGGIGNIPGAMLGGMILGIVESLGAGYISPTVERRHRLRAAGPDPHRASHRPAGRTGGGEAVMRMPSDNLLTRLRRIPMTVWYVALLVIAILLPLPLDNYLRAVLWPAGIYVLLGLSLNIIVGYAGMFQLGHAAFYAIGAYTVAILNLTFDVPIFLGMIAAIVVAGIAGFVLTRPILHLRGDYLAIVTIAFGEIVRMLLVNNIGGITGGANGLFGIDQPSIFGFTLPHDPQPLLPGAVLRRHHHHRHAPAGELAAGAGLDLRARG